MSTTRAEQINQDTETILLQYGVTDWKVQEVSLSRIDWRATRDIQNRPERYYPDVVLDYSSQMRNGAVFPRPVLRPAAGNKLQIVSGNHTCLAYQRIGEAKVEAYVLGNISSEIAYRLSPRFNRDNGLRVTQDHRMYQALHLHAIGMTMEQIIEDTGLTKSTVRATMRAGLVLDRAESLELKGLSNIPISSRALLSGIESDDVFRALADVAIGLHDKERNAKRGAGQKQKQLATLVSQVRLMPPEEALSAIRLFERDARRVQTHGKANDNDKLKQGCGKILAVNKLAVVRLTTDPEEAKATMEYCEKTAGYLMDLMDAIRDRGR
jgi:hypothetical protein